MIFFRVDASSEIGFGHIMRCISLAIHFQDHSIPFLFLLKDSDSRAASLLSGKGIPYKVMEAESDIEIIASTYTERIVVLDVNNRVVFHTIDDYRLYINFLKSKNFNVVSFEDFTTDEFDVDLAIVPYVGAEKLFENKDTTNYLIGASYFIFRNEFLSSPKVINRDNVNHVFVCMGGSDADQLTEKYLKLLVRAGYNFKISIVITHLTPERKKQIDDILHFHKGQSDIILNSSDMSKVIVSSDIGIINSGLIKYETSILGLPCISVSNNHHHEMVMKYFAEEVGVLHLGMTDEVTDNDFELNLKKLVEDHELRRTFSRNNILMFDGKGKERIFKSIMNLKMNHL